MNRPLRILLTISDLVGAGAERELSNLLAFLPRDRFEPHLCLWRPVFDYPVPSDTPVYVVHKYRPWDVARAASRLVGVIDEIRPDVVFSQLPYVSLVTGIAVMLSRHRPRWIARLAGNPYVDIRFPLLSLARRVYRNADHVVGCSRGVTAAITSHLQIDPERCSTLYNIVNTAEIRHLAAAKPAVLPTPNTFTIVHAGRFTKQKNQAMLLLAFSELREPAAELWMLGRGPLADRLQGLARQLRIDGQVRWLGFQKNPFAIFRAADCVALSSNHEGLPNVIVEALALGTPVVSTDCPFGPRELLSGDRDGLLVRVGDASQFATALRKMADADFRAKLRANIPADIGERFAGESLVPEYAELFERVANQCPTRSPSKLGI